MNHQDNIYAGPYQNNEGERVNINPFIGAAFDLHTPGYGYPYGGYGGYAGYGGYPGGPWYAGYGSHHGGKGYDGYGGYHGYGGGYGDYDSPYNQF
jgi:hypothetical protein